MGLDIDLDLLVETVTNEILKRLGALRPKKVLVLDDCPADIVSGGYEAVRGGDYGYVLLTAEAYKALADGKKPDPAPDEAVSEEESDCCAPAEEVCVSGRVIQMGAKRLLHERDLRDHNARRGDTVKISKKTIITALAADYAKSIGVKIIREA